MVDNVFVKVLYVFGVTEDPGKQLEARGVNGIAGGLCCVADHEAIILGQLIVEPGGAAGYTPLEVGRVFWEVGIYTTTP